MYTGASCRRHSHNLRSHGLVVDRLLSARKRREARLVEYNDDIMAILQCDRSALDLICTLSLGAGWYRRDDALPKKANHLTWQLSITVCLVSLPMTRL